MKHWRKREFSAKIETVISVIILFVLFLVPAAILQLIFFPEEVRREKV